MGLVFLCDVASPQRDAVERALLAGGHHVLVLSDSASLFSAQRPGMPGGGPPDCVVLTEAALGSPSALYATAARLRAERTGSKASLGVLGIIAKPEPEARAAALMVVDDVMSRPAALVELTARIEALLRRSGVTPVADKKPVEDPTSGLRTRMFLDERIGEEWRRASRFTEPMALVLVGLEGDSARAPNAERALRDVGGALKRSLRQIDVLGRFGGTELAALLVNTHLAGAVTCAERLHREIAGPGAVPSQAVELAIGLSLYPGKDVVSGTDLTRVAERALERARLEGAGSICLIQHQSYLFRGR